MLKVSTFILVVLAVCGSNQAIINPQLTPRHLVDLAELVVVGTIVKDGENWKLRVDDAVKGRAPAAFAIDLGNCDKEQADDIRLLLNENVSRPGVLITSKRVAKGKVHIGGVWMDVAGAGEAKWQILGNSSPMAGTFDGGTDMLARMVRHLVEHPDATLPCAAGVKWTDNWLGANIADASVLAAIEWPKNGTPALFVASSKGDRLLVSKGNDNAFDDASAAAGVTSKSAMFTFVDVDGDGVADLVSFDGSAINVYLGGKEFRAAGAQWTQKVKDCIGLAPCAVDGHPGVLVSTRDQPIVLVAQQGWRRVEIPKFEGNIGQVSRCIVADLDNDGYVDILEPGATGGALWKGKEGGFQAPVKSAVCTGGGLANQAVGDFNEDGFADIFLAGAEKNTLWENDGKCVFSDVFRYTGSLNRKCPPGAVAVGAMDLNHDGHTDLCLGYRNADVLYHFNRGFRSMGEEGEFRLPGLEPRPGSARQGLRSFAVADFNGDNSADLAVLQSDGAVRVCFNDRVDSPALMLRLPRGAAGPVTVSCWTVEKTPSNAGFAIVTGHAPGVYLPIRDKGVVNLRYRFPGRAASTMTVRVADTTSEVILENAGDVVAGPHIFSARIAAVRDGSLIVTVPTKPGDKPGGTFPVKVNDATAVMIDGEKKGLADLAVGQQARITIDADGQTAIAIEIGEKKAAPAK